MIEKFEKWLNNNLPKSAKNYMTGYKTLDNLSDELSLPLFNLWNPYNYNEYSNNLKDTDKFKELNAKGNNMYSATLSNFSKFLNTTIVIPPQLPFKGFKWRWAVTTPSEGLNRKDILIGVLKVLVKHNKTNHATQAFRDDLIILEDSIPNSKISLSKKEDKDGNPRPLSKNIIENSGQYWKALGLINTTSDGTIEVTDLGLSIINENLSDIDFIKNEIQNFTLPNRLIENSATITTYETNNINIKPLKLLIEVLSAIMQINKSPTDWFITVDELAKIIVPLSINSNIELPTYVEHIFGYRANKDDYSTWTNCTPEANDKRMIREYLLFLNNFGALTEIDIKNEGSRYYINEMTLTLIAEFGVDLETTSSSKPNDNTEASNIIYFGSPGTGKSYQVNEITKEKNVTQITFHPEYDYSSFVGGYKPTMNGKDIEYSFVPQAFTNIYVKAWNNYVSAEPKEHFYLQIEEINRGNCAEIFGDLFQLLDRDENGYSKYSVNANKELNDYLKNKFGNDEHKGLVDGKIRLPNNLTIIATMNTSDQSLFPMDSAFKRRWDWKYVRIDYKCPKSKFIIRLKNGKQYKWLEFLSNVNTKILEATQSQDKQIGNWFVIPKTADTIIEDDFINKVIFYLWNDVFKDEDDSIFQKDEKTIQYEDFFTNNDNSELVMYLLEERLYLKYILKEEDAEVSETEINEDNEEQ